MARKMDLSGKLDNELVDYISHNLPDTLDTKLEKAIGIYVLLCNILKYDPDYVVYGDYDRTNDYSMVNKDNNKIVCYHISTILYKLLCMYGIKSDLHGDLDGHMYVSLETDGMIIMIDSTRSGYFSHGYNMSDLANVKFGLGLNGISAMPYGAEMSKIPIVKEKCRSTIKSVYKKMGLKTSGSFKLNGLLERIYNKEDQNGVIFDEEGIDRNIRYANMFRYLEDSDIENIQMLNKVLSTIFKDVWDERAESITLYNESSGEVRTTKLVVLYDTQMKPYYYLFMNGKLRKWDKYKLCSYLIDKEWFFKRPTDIDAMDIEDDKVVYKLFKQ